MMAKKNTNRLSELGLALAITAAITFPATAGENTLTLGCVFTDHAVLQRQMPVAIWGFGSAGQTVEVAFAGHRAEAVVDADGRWRTELPAMEASDQGRELTARSGEARIVRRDVLVGEVWLAAGQSNMEINFTSRFADPATKPTEVPPDLRMFRLGAWPALRPVLDVPDAGPWKIGTAETATEFSMVGYFFGRRLHEQLNVPVGIIDISRGGTGVRAWMSPAALAAARGGKPRPEPSTIRQPDRDPDRKSNRDHYMYNGHLHPLIGLSVRGVAWYQGETDAVWMRTDYDTHFPAMVRDWRQRWGRDLPFVYVQLQSMSGKRVASVREAQRQALSMDHMAMAVIADISRGLHPSDKTVVGRRLADAALANVYDLDLPWTGPAVKHVSRQGRALRIDFDHAEGGLVLRAPSGKSEGTPPFELAGVDEQYHPAEAVVDGDSLIVTSPSVTEPVSVRYAYSAAPPMVLFNQDGLPASPFVEARATGQTTGR